jgi:hypothetical protein
MGSYNPFEYLKHKLWPKERSRIKMCQFDSWPLKFGNYFDLLVFKWCATYHWKALNKGYNFVSYLTSIRGPHKKLRASKMSKVLISGISGFPTWESQEKNDIWVLSPWIIIRNTTRGKVVVFPKSGSWWVLRIRVCLWFVYAQKMIQLCTNQLVVWFVQVHVNN